MAGRRRSWFLGVVALIVAGLACPAVIPRAAAAPVSAARGGARAAAVTSGDARFEVLSPTLIRTEYAGDQRFVDAGTFNVIGRDDFAPTHFTARTAGGWLTIATSALTLRYRVGSGPFGTRNLQVSLRAGAQPVTAEPWASEVPPSCAIGVLCEAEDLSLGGVSVANDHTGYTGTGFAAGFQSTGNSLSFQVTVATAGTYQFDARYANSVGGDGQDTTRTLTVAADGGAGATLTMPTTADWNTWAIASADLTLTAGTHTVTVTRAASDSGNVNLDSVALVTPGAAYPSPPPPAVHDCAFGTVCEAESGTLAGGAALASDHNDYSGAGFVAGLATGASDTVHITGVPVAGPYALQVRYANAQDSARTVSVQAGSAAATTGQPGRHQQLGLLAHGGGPGPAGGRGQRRDHRVPGRQQLPAQPGHGRGDQARCDAAGAARAAGRVPARPGRRGRVGRHHPGPAVPGRLVAAGRHQLGPVQPGAPRRSPRGPATTGSRTRTGTCSATATTTRGGSPTWPP